MLHPIPEGVPVVGTPVGLVNPTRLKELGAAITARNVGSVLSYDGRQALIDGQPVEHDAIAEPLWEAIDTAARRLFGPREWSSDLSAITGMNARSMMRGRIVSNGLPPAILALLGRAASSRSPRVLGHLMLAIAWMWDEAVRDAAREGDEEVSLAPGGRLSPQGQDLLQERLDALQARALELVGEMQADCRGPQGIRSRRVTEPQPTRSGRQQL
ncbi:hypothetical protein Mchl_1948 [Methylorubrum extorquens CM4]|uniref:Uncharacterized protein n=2 Tax=Methylorubrum extorquens TaxID=408 RepID=B7KVZ5_METC4|nr:hypothetical protein Mchl_1948 [Methylorubrum extorquens CM4]